MAAHVYLGLRVTAQVCWVSMMTDHMYAGINGGPAYRLGINVGPSCMSRIKGGCTYPR